jgi:hypothetical protein
MMRDASKSLRKAMGRGLSNFSRKIDGRSTSLEAVKLAYPEWLKDKKIALKRHPDLPDAPTCIELAKAPEQVKILKAVVAATKIGKPILSSPGAPVDCARALRILRRPRAELKFVRCC